MPSKRKANTDSTAQRLQLKKTRRQHGAGATHVEEQLSTNSSPDVQSESASELLSRLEGCSLRELQPLAERIERLSRRVQASEERKEQVTE